MKNLIKVVFTSTLFILFIIFFWARSSLRCFAVPRRFVVCHFSMIEKTRNTGLADTSLAQATIPRPSTKERKAKGRPYRIQCTCQFSSLPQGTPWLCKWSNYLWYIPINSPFLTPAYFLLKCYNLLKGHSSLASVSQVTCLSFFVSSQQEVFSQSPRVYSVIREKSKQVNVRDLPK